MQCKKCNANFAGRQTIDGKRVNLQNRKYCLVCSPFKQHNTKDLTQTTVVEKKCQLCDKLMLRKLERKGKLCWSCTNRKSRTNKIDRVKQIVGFQCWFCDYKRCWSAMEFHHLDPSTKLFGLSVREMQFSWEKIFAELQKCVLACACCHREIHVGLVSLEKVEKTFNEHWGSYLKGKGLCS